MTRTPLAPRTGRSGRAANRMAPGGRLRSEASVRPVLVRVGTAGNYLYEVVIPPAAAPLAYPDWMENVGNGYQVVVGGTVKEVSSDASDATYLSTFCNGTARTTLVEIEPWALPSNRTIVSATLQMRVRVETTAPLNEITYELRIGNQLRSQTATIYTVFYPIDPSPTADWQIITLNALPYYNAESWLSTLASGGLQIAIVPHSSIHVLTTYYSSFWINIILSDLPPTEGPPETWWASPTSEWLEDTLDWMGGTA